MFPPSLLPVDRDPSTSSAVATVQLSASETSLAYSKAAAAITKTVTLPGFRKGQAIPPKVLEGALGDKDQIRKDAIQALLTEVVAKAVEDEADLNTIGSPTLVSTEKELLNAFIPGEPMEMKVKCDLYPDLTWTGATAKPYFGLTGTYVRAPFDEDRYNAAVMDLRNRAATTQVKEEAGVPLALGDACIINMKGFFAADGGGKGLPLPNAASGETVDVIMEVGRYMPGLVEGLVGKVAGDETSLAVTFPLNLNDKTIAGKDAVFEVTVQSVSARDLPVSREREEGRGKGAESFFSAFPL